MSGFFPSSLVHRPAPAGSLPKCAACGLFKTCQSPKMKPYGNFARRVLIVGEAPGETEDNEGRPFIGKAGQFLREKLDSIGIDMDEDAATTNALICRPPGNKTPDPKQVAYCRPNITHTLQSLGPLVVVCLGRIALTSVLQPYWNDIDALERWVGWRIPLAKFWLCPTYHPSYLLRIKSQVADRMFVNHLAMAFGIQNDPPPQWDYESRINVLLDEDQVELEIEKMHQEDDWAAVDYETNCIKPDYPKARLVSCALANSKRTISYPWTARTAAATGELLHNHKVRKIASNLKMEERWTLKEFGKGVASWGWDTMLATHCLDNRPGICSLKFQSLVQFGVPPYNTHIEPFLTSSHGHYNRIEQIDLKQLLFYGGMDAALEYRLARRQRKEMEG